MKITILAPRTEFTKRQQLILSNLGEVVYTKSRGEYSAKELLRLAKGTNILAADPDNFGGFEKAQEGRFTRLLERLPNLKGIALSTTSFSWIDLDYCRKRSLAVTNAPFYSTESVAEHVLALLICLAKKIVISDRKTILGKYEPDMGFELKGKTLGIIGLGHIGSRVAELGHAIGMKVIAYNRTLKRQKNVTIKSLQKVLAESDAISVNLAHNEKTDHFISEKALRVMKKEVIIVNLATREIVDEEAMANALREGKVTSYAYEGEDLKTGPLAKIETAIGLKAFAWYTKEALERATEIWTRNITSLAKGKPINIVSK